MTETLAPPLVRSRWLFSPAVDLSVFLGSAALALALVALGRAAGLDVTPEWTWIGAVLLVDVAHVWSTAFRVYLDRDELARRPVLYLAVPVLAFAAGVALHARGELVFWRALAYLAVFHFVRQQWGWVALYRARAGERTGRWLDMAAVYLAMLYPLAEWHASLPRRFSWFLEGDFVAAPSLVAAALRPLWALALALYALRSLRAWLAGRANPGKDVVVATTAACWWLGIVGTNSDYAFTVTNVLIHGVPYLALVWWHGRARRREGRGAAIFALGPWAFLLALWAIAFAEELVWDRGVWHERAWLFGEGWQLGSAARTTLVALLAVPQITHYVLDGFVWRRKTNPTFTLVPRDVGGGR